jgi:hypothetical protein
MKWPFPRADGDYIDVEDPTRKRSIREAEYQAAANRDSRVMRGASRRARLIHLFIRRNRCSKPSPSC